MMTVEQLQEPQALRLAMGELTGSELRIAQAAVRFAHFHITHAIVPVPSPKAAKGGDGATFQDERYVKGWNDCRDVMLSMRSAALHPKN